MNYYMDLFVFMDYATITVSVVAIGLSVAALTTSIKLRRQAFRARDEARGLSDGPNDAGFSSMDRMIVEKGPVNFPGPFRVELGKDNLERAAER